MKVQLREPKSVMKLSKLGSFHQTKLSFLRSFLNEFKDWKYKRDLFDLDEYGYGRAVYSFQKWIMGLPLKIRFRRSGLYISLIPPYIIGFFVGIFSSIMGVGGGFIIIPAMIYILRMPTNVVVGTSLYQIIFITSFVTILHASTNQSVDIILALILLLGGAIGAQIGVRLSGKLNGAWLRIALAILVLAVGLIMASELIIKPENVIKIISG